MYGLEHHIVEINGDVTDAGRTNDKRRTTNDEQGKIELLSQMDAGWLSFAIISKIFQKYLSHIFLRMQSDHYWGCGPIYPAAATIIPFHIIFHIVFHTILFQNIFKEFLILKHISWDAI